MFAMQPAAAVQPNEILKDPQLEERARKLSAVLRCLVCQNQSIDDSNAPLARDLRLLVRERLEAGDSDDAVMDFIVNRYGEFVLLRPRFGVHTLLLWLTPFLVLVMGVFMIRAVFRRRAALATDKAAPLSEAEAKRLKSLLKEDEAH
ncbi:MAG: cytochrome c-type biogenesis protein [Hyphomicrobiaceae bacterium]